jgi:DNA-binding NarL/FixJ family response regulator
MRLDPGRPLSPQERRVAALLRIGASNHAIGDVLGLSNEHVGAVVMHIRRKLGAHDRAALIAALTARAEELRV